jgi:hypothetical protein
MNKRGNPDWGKPLLLIPSLVTEFESEVARLGLQRRDYAASVPLKRWCYRNRNRVYVPEWLLDEWGMKVDLILGAAQRFGRRDAALSGEPKN